MDAMLIECILKRDGGSKVDLGDNTYHFAPDSEGRHVAMVADPDHIGRFLSISEGYRIPVTEQPSSDSLSYDDEEDSDDSHNDEGHHH